MSDYFEDIASLLEWFEENATCFIIPYIEQHFKPVSFSYEFNFMNEHLIFSKAIIEDYQKSNEQKVEDLIDSVSYGKSKIIVIVGARGSGKTATALWLAEQSKQKGNHEYIYYVGKPENSDMYPSWIKFVSTLDDLPHSCFAIVDEAAIKYNARKFQQEQNVELTEKMVIARHQDKTLILITQNIKLVDINVSRLYDIVLFKMGTEYGLQRKRAGEGINAYEKEKMLIRNRLKPKTKQEVLIEYLTGPVSIFYKFTHGLPSFWDNEKISKSFKNYRKEEEDKKKVKPTIRKVIKI